MVMPLSFTTTHINIIAVAAMLACVYEQESWDQGVGCHCDIVKRKKRKPRLRCFQVSQPKTAAPNACGNLVEQLWAQNCLLVE